MITQIVLLLVPAVIIIVSVSALADHIETLVFNLVRESGRSTDEAARAQEALEKVRQARSEMSDLRDQVEANEKEISKLKEQRETLSLQGEKMSDPSENAVAEIGYPSPGDTGYYARVEGPALALPFAGVASSSTAVGGRRSARIIIWGRGPAESERMVQEWILPDGKVTLFRPFTGILKQTEL